MKTHKIDKWLGLNQSPDGDTGLTAGEAAVMKNWRITPENHLRIRPGYKTRLSLPGTPRAVLPLRLSGQSRLLYAAGGTLYEIGEDLISAAGLATVADAPSCLFAFGGYAYFIDGTQYYRYDGQSLSVVEGYIPLICTQTTPAGQGNDAEGVNILTGKKRQSFSADGASTVFHLAEDEIDEIVWVKIGGEPTQDYSANLSDGTLTFVTAPTAEEPDNVEICWRKGTGSRNLLTGCANAVSFGGDCDTRLFLYGDGTNAVRYSGLDGDGQPSAEYFPAGNVMTVGTANTPVTDALRHYDRLMLFKDSEAWTAAYTTVEDAQGQSLPAFSVQPLNAQAGCQAPGQAVLVDNCPFTPTSDGIYKWVSSSVRDEKNARIVSERVREALENLDPDSARCFDDRLRQEWWYYRPGYALIYQYGADAWYVYEDIPARILVRFGGALLAGCEGMLVEISDGYRNDDAAEIEAVMETGDIDFGMAHRKKHTPFLFFVLKPESGGRVTASISDSNDPAKESVVAASGLSSFSSMQFCHFAFCTNRRPHTQRLALRARNYTFCRLRLYSRSSSAAATVISASVPVVIGETA